MKINHEITHKIITIYIDNIPHIQFDRETVDSFHSWSYFNGVWSIEILFKSGSCQLLEYDSKEKWVKILNILSKNLFVY